MLHEKEVKTARKLMSRLEEIEEMQEYKIMILKVTSACEESATMIGSYIDVLIAEFKEGRPTAENIETLRLLKQTHGRVLIAVVHLRAELEGIYETTEEWMELGQRDRRRRGILMKAAMDKALEIAAEAKGLDEGGELLGDVVRSWKEGEGMKN